MTMTSMSVPDLARNPVVLLFKDKSSDLFLLYETSF